MITKTKNYTFKKNSTNVFSKTKLMVSILLFTLTIFTSCKTDGNTDDDDDNDGVALQQRFQDNRTNALQTFVIDASTGGTITGSQGTSIIIPANAIGLNGTPVAGNIDIELVEIYAKGAMVLQDMSTKGKMTNGDEEALISAGEFFVNARQNGTQLEVLLPITLESRGVAPADWEPMQVFRAGDDLDDDDLWREADENNDGQNDDAQGREGQGPNGAFVLYHAFDMSGFGWTNLDIWYNYTGQLTDLYVDVPDGFNGDNSAVYLSYDGENGLAAMDIYDAGLEQFTEHYGRIPVGQQVHFIMITEVSGQLQYAIQAATIVDGHVEIIPSLQPTTQANLEALINALP